MGQLQKTIVQGKSYVLVPEEDYEDMRDVIVANQIMERVRAGEETWPAELVYELMETDSRIRTYRAYRKMSLSELAGAADISEPDLSDIESGRKNGAVEVLKRIASALKVDLDDLVP